MSRVKHAALYFPYESGPWFRFEVLVKKQQNWAHTWPYYGLGFSWSNSKKLMDALSNAISPPNLKDQFVDYIWGALKPYALTLRDIIMHSNQPLQEPPDLSGGSPSTPLRLPSIQTRRAACTHLTMGRLNGMYECMICHKPSELGWVYSCTQDDEQCPLRNFALPTQCSEDLG